MYVAVVWHFCKSKKSALLSDTLCVATADPIPLLIRASIRLSINAIWVQCMMSVSVRWSSMRRSLDAFLSPTIPSVYLSL